MKHIDKTATQILDQLVEDLRMHARFMMKKNKAFTAQLEVTNTQGRFPITIESLGAVSLGPLFSLICYNGALRDPKVVFLYTLKSYYPIAYQQDSLEIYKESVRFKGGNLVAVIPRLQHWQAAFANRWLGGGQKI